LFSEIKTDLSPLHSGTNLFCALGDHGETPPLHQAARGILMRGSDVSEHSVNTKAEEGWTMEVWPVMGNAAACWERGTDSTEGMKLGSSEGRVGARTAVEERAVEKVGETFFPLVRMKCIHDR
jgi:hypothetical protein